MMADVRSDKIAVSVNRDNKELAPRTPAIARSPQWLDDIAEFALSPHI